METINVKSVSSEELIEITGEVSRIVKNSGKKEGICIIYTPHTTAAITINENADRTVKSDILKGLKHLDFERVRFDHGEGNSPSHLKSSIIGCSETLMINRGSLELGTWQGIFFCEFDGPRSRKVHIKVL